MAWYDEAVFYHIYPLGLTGAPEQNDYQDTQARLLTLLPWVDHIRKLGCTALYIGPLFESVGHGYETTDYRKLDCRLGTNEDLKTFVTYCHNSGIRVVLDGVFNHTGRDFFAFKDIQEHREASRYCDWYCNVNFWGNNEFGDGFSYDNWRGYNVLVKLNLRNPEVVSYLLDAVEYWIREFDIDGIRLDCADVLDFDFMRMLRGRTDSLKTDFWLMGEVIHGEYHRWANGQMLHSVTNYHLHKALYSGHNDHNYFEIAHTVKRQIDMGLGGIRLYNFVDNHDVERIFTKLSNKSHFLPVHILLYTLPGVPSLYYGSEFAIEGRKEKHSDASLRPALNLEDLEQERGSYETMISRLGQFYKHCPQLWNGSYRELQLTTGKYAFAREDVIVTVNNEDHPVEFEIAMEGDYVGLLSGQTANSEQGRLHLMIDANGGEIWAPRHMIEGYQRGLETDVEGQQMKEKKMTKSSAKKTMGKTKPKNALTKNPVEKMAKAAVTENESNETDGQVIAGQFTEIDENVRKLEKKQEQKNRKTSEVTNKEVQKKSEETLPQPRRSVAFIGSECYPFVKTGGLGDVMYALPKALVKQNCDVKVILPRYKCIPWEYQEKMVYRGDFMMDLCLDGRSFYVGIMEYVWDGVVYDFIDNEEFFSSGNPYTNLIDDIPKFCYFAKAALAALNYMNWVPDIIHCHDWQASLVPVYLRTLFANTPVGSASVMLTIHNLRFQGIYNIPTIRYWTGLPDYVFNKDALKQGYEDANMLKGGIAYCNMVTTVSPTYAGEIQGLFYGEGLDAHLRYHSGKLRGIINGIDYQMWDPKTDPLLAANYDSQDCILKKKENKKALQEMLGLKQDDHMFVIGLISRLTDQKGLDLVNAILPSLLDGHTQIVILGTGDFRYENAFRYYENINKGIVCSNIMYDEGRAHAIYAGADALLVPSLFEPCGLTQLNAMRYGTIPIVRETGGLKDTVQPYNQFTGEGNGFTFDRYESWLLYDAINRAKTLYFTERPNWDAMVQRDMEKDVSWDNSAKQYRALYLELRP